MADRFVGVPAKLASGTMSIIVLVALAVAPAAAETSDSGLAAGIIALAMMPVTSILVERSFQGKGRDPEEVLWC